MNLKNLKRLLSPRIFIYSILAVALAWLMHQHSRLQEQKRLDAERMVNACTEQNAVRPYQENMPLKKSELKNSRPGECTLPMMILLTENQDQDPFFLKLKKKYEKQFSVIKVNCLKDNGSRKYFKADKLPVLILYSRTNQELGRLEDELDETAVNALLDRTGLEREPLRGSHEAAAPSGRP